MQGVELHPLGVIEWRGSHIPQRSPQHIHARDDAELRDQRERQHQTEQHVPRCEHMRRPIGKAAMQQGTRQKNHSGKEANPMQLAKRPPYDIASSMSAWQALWNRKRRRREDERKKDQAANPDDERQKHEKAKE